MTENKRFEVVMNEFDEVEYIMDTVMMEDRDFAEFMDFVEDVCKENEQLKSFIKKLTNHNGEILLMNGYGYTKSYVEKLLNEKELRE